jgi:hypothetical protein
MATQSAGQLAGGASSYRSAYRGTSGHLPASLPEYRSICGIIASGTCRYGPSTLLCMLHNCWECAQGSNVCYPVHPHTTLEAIYRNSTMSVYRRTLLLKRRVDTQAQVIRSVPARRCSGFFQQRYGLLNPQRCVSGWWRPSQPRSAGACQTSVSRTRPPPPDRAHRGSGESRCRGEGEREALVGRFDGFCARRRSRRVGAVAICTLNICRHVQMAAGICRFWQVVNMGHMRSLREKLGSTHWPTGMRV